MGCAAVCVIRMSLRVCSVSYYYNRMPTTNDLRPGRHVLLDGCRFVIESIAGDDVYLIQLARPGERVARGPWIYSRAQLETLLASEAW